MLDPQKLRMDPEAVAQALAPRGYDLDVKAWRQLEQQRKELQINMQELQNRKNQDAKAIGQAKSRGEDIQPLLDSENWQQYLDDHMSQYQKQMSQARQNVLQKQNEQF